MTLLINKITSRKYRYLVSISNVPSIPMCKYPRETIITGIRENKYIYEYEKIKKIIYPSELLFTQVNENDIIEHDIIELKNIWPNWYSIQVELFNNHIPYVIPIIEN